MSVDLLLSLATSLLLSLATSLPPCSSLRGPDVARDRHANPSQAAAKQRPAKALPPGWQSVRHESKVRSYFSYCGPDDTRSATIKNAWEQYEASCADAARRGEPPPGAASSRPSADGNPPVKLLRGGTQGALKRQSDDSAAAAADTAGAAVEEGAEDEQIGEACEVCGDESWAVGNEMLLCDGESCGRAFHTRCLDPPLDGVPSGEWFCPQCVAAGPAEPQAPVSDDGSGPGWAHTSPPQARARAASTAQAAPTADSLAPLPRDRTVLSSLFCRRCFTYDCSQHGVVQPRPTWRYAAIGRHAVPPAAAEAAAEGAAAALPAAVEPPGAAASGSSWRGQSFSGG